ncbi:precorrin-8X methylmutase [Denitrobaculum tricleocarpae]|uniref:Precorrin-8X methylmutase n=1 Tax=Denitrobaculum tricleocarpae TaxID=2591009 RepID=A0A545TMH3_9PROT|nr:precorrin-8X methylmutase [Denitrobaculum tricleocarpae]TQV78433.1 precorrin-8X methylmutase [Denitrobaculum tricleocarpae]
MPSYDYIRDPQEIYRQSFATVRAEADFSDMDAELATVAERLIHACGMPDILEDLAWTADAAKAGREALRAGAPILADCRMVVEGVIRAGLPRDNAVFCSLNDERTRPLAAELETTRSAAAVELWQDHLEGAVVAVGNAPTALFHLLEILGKGAPKPAVILGFPVGFVGAAESKEALIEADLAVPYITLRRRRGGSAIAAAGVNALAGLAKSADMS